MERNLSIREAGLFFIRADSLAGRPLRSHHCP
jgi:hypothetical protein